MSLVLDKIVEKYKQISTNLLSSSSFLHEIEIVISSYSFVLEKTEKDLIIISSKNSAEIYNFLNSLSLYDVICSKNQLSIKNKGVTLDIKVKKMKLFSSRMKEMFNSEISNMKGVEFSLKGKKKDKLSDEEKHSLNSELKQKAKVLEEFSSILKNFETKIVK